MNAGSKYPSLHNSSMQHARTNGDGSVVQARNRIDLTVSVEPCRPPESARAARTRMVGAIAVRSAVTCG